MNKTFYDIHCHAMNLSHPNLSAFINRIDINRLMRQLKLLTCLNGIPIVSSIVSFLLGRKLDAVKGKVNRVNNLLSVMENDLGSYFLLMENCLKQTGNCLEKSDAPLLREDGLHIGGNVYQKIVLTPLLMDFGCKDIRNPDIHYEKPNKPIAEQVTDVFSGIKKYKDMSVDNVFEIYPFLGLNTKNYTLDEIKELLDKYFADYRGKRDDLYANMGKFDGNINNMKSNFFAGIKVYPPLGFDPWPDPAEYDFMEQYEEEVKKVKYLYGYCSGRKIPITTHCSDGGFRVDENALDYTAPSRWEKVLREYPEIKLNFAHFGKQRGSWYKKLWRFFSAEELWVKTILRLVASYNNVYVDFSYSGVDDEYYSSLRELINNQPHILRGRILFGTDFMINLMAIESYNKYLDIFSKNSALSDPEKHGFSCINPEQFLFC